MQINDQFRKDFTELWKPYAEFQTQPEMFTKRGMKVGLGEAFINHLKDISNLLDKDTEFIKWSDDSKKEESVETTNKAILLQYKNDFDQTSDVWQQGMVFDFFSNDQQIIKDQEIPPFDTRELFEIIHWVWASSAASEHTSSEQAHIYQANKSLYRLLMRDVQMRTLSHF